MMGAGECPLCGADLFDEIGQDIPVRSNTGQWTNQQTEMLLAVLNAHHARRHTQAELEAWSIVIDEQVRVALETGRL